MKKQCLKGCPKGTKLRALEHPGYEYKGEQMNTFPGKFCVKSTKGAFFGYVARFKLWVDVMDIDCLTIFTLEDAHRFATHQMEIAK